MNRTKRFAINVVVSIVYQIICILSGFIVPRLIMQCYGSEKNGLVTSISQFIAYFNLVEVGLAAATIYALYKPLANKNNKEIHEIMSASNIYYRKSGILFFLMIGILALVYPFIIKIEGMSIFEVAALIIVFGIRGYFEFFDFAKYKALFTADQKQYIVSIALSVYQIAYISIVVVLSISKINIVLVFLVSIVAFVFRSLIMTVFVKKTYKHINFKAEPNFKALDKRWDALFLQILGVVQNAGPVVIATLILSLKDVSIYSVYNLVIVGINGVLSIFANSLYTGFGDLISRKESRRLQEAYSDFEFLFFMLISIVFGVSIVMIQPFINLYTSGIADANYNQQILGWLFVVNAFLYHIKTPTGMLVMSAGLYKETKYRSLIQAIILVVLGFVLTPIWGLEGLLIASCLSNLYRDIDLIIYIPRKVTHLPIIASVVRVIKATLVIFILFLVSYFNEIKIASVYDWIIYAFIFTIGTTIICVLFGLTEKRRMNSVIMRVRGVFQND